MQPAQLSASFPLTNSVEDCTVVSGCQSHSLLQNPYYHWYRSPDTGSLDIWDLQSLAVKPLWQIEFEIKWFESMPMCSLASERHLSSQSMRGFLILHRGLYTLLQATWAVQCMSPHATKMWDCQGDGILRSSHWLLRIRFTLNNLAAQGNAFRLTSC